MTKKMNELECIKYSLGVGVTKPQLNQLRSEAKELDVSVSKLVRNKLFPKKK